jgi:perosamine synthetase
VIPVNEPSIGDLELEYVTECLRSGWISSAGRFLDEFEQAWAEYCDMPYGVAVMNGTAALDAAVSCLRLQPGDEVIMPTMTIISCAQSVIGHGGVPVLVDCDPDTWCMDVEQVRAKVSPRTRAIMPVHIYGHPVNMDPILDLAPQHGIVVIEDAAEAHGAEYKGRRCGGLGDISVFSFYANKVITTGEGGMVLTRDRDYADHVRSYRNLCFRPEQRFLHTEIGRNYRMTNVQAAIGVAQLRRIDELLAAKRVTADIYNRALDSISALQLPVEREYARSNYWMYAVVVSESSGFTGDSLSHRLRGLGVDTRPFFLGMHRQPALRRLGLFEGEEYPVSDRLATQGIYLPSGTALTPLQAEQVCGAVREVFA